MKHKRRNPLITTLFCAALILGAGYIGIVKSGELLLHKEEKPQKAEYEQSGAKVFYSKIGDDIPLFPWNYYEENEAKKITEEFLAETGLAIYRNGIGYSPLDIEFTSYMNYNFYAMIAENCDVSLAAISRIYEEKNSGIMENIRVSQSEYGMLFFYQDTLTVEGKQYQVKLAFSEYQPVSFLCVPCQAEDARDTEEWKKGKEKLVHMLDKYPQELLLDIYAMESWDSRTGDAFGKNKKWEEEKGGQQTDGLGEISHGEIYIKYMEYMQEILQNTASKVENTNWNINIQEEIATEHAEQTYQVIERKDVILLLLESDRRAGIYYDPVNQKFCGYNYFY